MNIEVNNDLWRAILAARKSLKENPEGKGVRDHSQTRQRQAEHANASRNGVHNFNEQQQRQAQQFANRIPDPPQPTNPPIAQFPAPTANPEYIALVDRIADMSRAHPTNTFLRSLQGQSQRHNLTQNQLQAAIRVMDELDAQGVRPPLNAGRQHLQGTITKVKIHPSTQYGNTLKMGVTLKDGNKVWGTVPHTLKETLQQHVGAVSLAVPVAFFATVEDGNDPHFRFFNHPTMQP